MEAQTNAASIRFLTFDSMDTTLKCDHSLEIKAVEQYFNCGAVCFNFTQFVILQNLSILNSALSGVKGLTNRKPLVLVI